MKTPSDVFVDADERDPGPVSKSTLDSIVAWWKRQPEDMRAKLLRSYENGSDRDQQIAAAIRAG